MVSLAVEMASLFHIYFGAQEISYGKEPTGIFFLSHSCSLEVVLAQELFCNTISYILVCQKQIMEKHDKDTCQCVSYICTWIHLEALREKMFSKVSNTSRKVPT